MVNTKDKQIVEAKLAAKKAIEIAEAQRVEHKKLKEAVRRDKIMNDLTAPLSKDQREIMTDLLESVQTDRLQKSFDKYLPSVIDGNTPAKRKAVLSEAKEITGNKETNVSSVSVESTNNIVDIRRLAGLK